MPQPKTHPEQILEFDLNTGKRRFSGKITIPEGKEKVTLPMMINSLMIKLSDDHPEVHKATQMLFSCSLK